MITGNQNVELAQCSQSVLKFETEIFLGDWFKIPQNILTTILPNNVKWQFEIYVTFVNPNLRKLI